MSDRKRFVGPESGSLPYQSFIAAAKSIKTNQHEAIDKGGKRLDGRTCVQARPIYLRTGLITQANGSAYMELPEASLKMVAAVHGPRQAQRRETFKTESTVYCTVDFLPFAHATRTPLGGASSAIQQQTGGGNATRRTSKIATMLERWVMSAVLPAILVDRYPKSTIDIFVTIIQTEIPLIDPDLANSMNDIREMYGGLCSACITCVTMALADAGIEIMDLVTATYAVRVQDRWLLDPTPEEESKATAGVVLALMPSLNEVTSVVERGSVDGTRIMEAIELCTESTGQIHAAMGQCLTESMDK